MRSLMTVLGLLAIALFPANPARAGSFTVTNLVADQLGVGATTDSHLVNAWGIASSATSPFWIGSNGAGLSTLYDGAGSKLGLEVHIPGDGSVTGVVFNGGGGFNGDVFLFASEDGTVSGWRSALGTSAETLQLPSDDVYKGLAVGTVGGHSYIYLANFHTGAIDVLKGDAGAPDLAGSFTDPGVPSGYAPFNVENIGGVLYVTYALQGSGIDDAPGAGHGIITKFDLNGNFLGRLVSFGALNSPWGVALAPAGFYGAAEALLVGNFGDGMINAYDPLTGTLLGSLLDSSDTPIVIDGLWGLRFGNGGNGGALDTLYFTAGPGGETHGLFGQLEALSVRVPEPGTWLLLSSALAALCLVRKRGSTT